LPSAAIEPAPKASSAKSKKTLHSRLCNISEVLVVSQLLNSGEAKSGNGEFGRIRAYTPDSQSRKHRKTRGRADPSESVEIDRRDQVFVYADTCGGAEAKPP
jgi:hypothetical protein